MNIKIHSSAYLPSRAHKNDAGYDLYAPYGISLPAGRSCIIDVGVGFEIPKGYAGFIESRSSFNVKQSIGCFTGVVDSGYTGSVKVKLYNLSDKDYFVEKGDRIAQIVFVKVKTPKLKVVKAFKTSDRGCNGLGSSGR